MESLQNKILTRYGTMDGVEKDRAYLPGGRNSYCDSAQVRER